jgi:hypothetical protein
MLAPIGTQPTLRAGGYLRHHITHHKNIWLLKPGRDVKGNLVAKKLRFPGYIFYFGADGCAHTDNYTANFIPSSRKDTV